MAGLFARVRLTLADYAEADRLQRSEVAKRVKARGAEPWKPPEPVPLSDWQRAQMVVSQRLRVARAALAFGRDLHRQACHAKGAA